MSHKPGFVLVGTAKAGTSFLLRYLNQHSRLWLPESNELYFHSNLKECAGPYDAEFKSKVISRRELYYSIFSGADSDALIGEVATDYLYDFTNAIHSIRKELGESVKIIVVLRHPVDRTFSHYRHMVSKFHEPLSFEEALEAQSDRKAQGWRWVYQYESVSRYSEGVNAYLKAFPKVHVVIYEDLLKAPEMVIDGIYGFLGVPVQHFSTINEKVNVKKIYRSSQLMYLSKIVESFDRRLNLKGSLYQKFSGRFENKLALSDGTRNQLLQSFLKETVALEHMLGIDLSHWKV